MFEMTLKKENGKVVVSPTIEKFTEANPSVRVINNGSLSTFVDGEKVKFTGFTPVSYQDTRTGKSGEFAAIVFADERIISAGAYQRSRYDRATNQPIPEVGKVGVADLVAEHEYIVRAVPYMDAYGYAHTKYYLVEG